MMLAIFDLDHTLLDGDSDHLWGEFLVRMGALDADRFRRESARFTRDYNAGSLNAADYYRFALSALTEHPVERLLSWRERYLEECVRPRVAEGAFDLLASHRAAGHTLMIITATSHFLTEPIAHFLGVDVLLATEPEMLNGCFTGLVQGIPCLREGKVQRLEEWLSETDEQLAESWFYSDSNNDLPLLERVDHPVTVHPDPILKTHARRRGWPIVNIRGQSSYPTQW